MIAVKEEDRDILRFLWVDDVKSAEPKVVKYTFMSRIWSHFEPLPVECNSTGISSHKREDPEVVSHMLCLLYVDDLSLNLEDIDKAYHKSRERMTQGRFNLRKWLTNSRHLVTKIQAMESQTEVSIKTERGNQFTEDDETFNRVMVGRLEERHVNTEQKVLVTNWNYFSDEFLFKFQTHVECTRNLTPTKRNVLRVIKF